MLDSTELNPLGVYQRLASSVVGTCAIFLSSFALLGCVSQSPGRLDETNFDKWVRSANDYVMADSEGVKSQGEQVASTQSELERVSSRIEKLIDYAGSTTGEASWVILGWSANSRKIGTLFDYFLTRGYLLNYKVDSLGGNYLIPMGRDRYGLTYANTGLSRIFNDSKTFISPWIVNDSEFPFATSYGPAPFLNQERAEELKALILSGAKADEAVSLGVDLGVVMQMLAAREVARSTLSARYGFHMDRSFDFEEIEASIPGLSIKTANEVHEFFAQATSLAAHPFALYLLVADTLRVLDNVVTEEDSEYSRTANGKFFVASVNEILARLGRPYDVDSAFRINTLREADGRWKAVGKIGNEILVQLGQRGLDDLRADYVQYAKTILNHIDTDS